METWLYDMFATNKVKYKPSFWYNIEVTLINNNLFAPDLLCPIFFCFFLLYLINLGPAGVAQWLYAFT